MTWQRQIDLSDTVAMIATMFIVSSEQLTGTTEVNVDIAIQRAIDVLQLSGEAVVKIAPSDDPDEDESEKEQGEQ